MRNLGVVLLITANTTRLFPKLVHILDPKRATVDPLVARGALEPAFLDAVDIIVDLVFLAELRRIRDILPKKA